MAQDYNPDLSASFDALQRPMPHPEHPDGSIVGDMDVGTNPSENPELLHRPHAFALMHGEDGAKVAFGQLLWRIDCFSLNWEGTTDYISYSSQESISGTHSRIPKTKTEDGAVMDAGINNTKYHELGAYGDVYLVWKANLEHSPKEVGDEIDAYDVNDENKSEITKCWVQVEDPASPIGVGDIGEIKMGGGYPESGSSVYPDPPPSHYPAGDWSTERRTSDAAVYPMNGGHDGTGTPEGGDAGIFKVKLGTVNEDEEVIQLISSDVPWFITVMEREYGASRVY